MPRKMSIRSSRFNLGLEVKKSENKWPNILRWLKNSNNNITKITVTVNTLVKDSPKTTTTRINIWVSSKWVITMELELACREEWLARHIFEDRVLINLLTVLKIIGTKSAPKVSKKILPAMKKEKSSYLRTERDTKASGKKT